MGVDIATGPLSSPTPSVSVTGRSQVLLLDPLLDDESPDELLPLLDELLAGL